MKNIEIVKEILLSGIGYTAAFFSISIIIGCATPLIEHGTKDTICSYDPFVQMISPCPNKKAVKLKVIEKPYPYQLKSDEISKD